MKYKVRYLLTIVKCSDYFLWFKSESPPFKGLTMLYRLIQSIFLFYFENIQRQINRQPNDSGNLLVTLYPIQSLSLVTVCSVASHRYKLRLQEEAARLGGNQRHNDLRTKAKTLFRHHSLSNKFRTGSVHVMMMIRWMFRKISFISIPTVS